MSLLFGSRLELTWFKDIGNQRHRWVMSSSSSERQQLRQAGRLARRQLSPSQRLHATQRLNKKLCYQLRGAKRIALYLAFDGEPDLMPCLATLIAQGKQVYLPQLGRQGMRFVALSALLNARVNRYGIIEPAKHAASIPAQRLQAIVMPLTAYDSAGNRLGMGAGFYDRKLSWRTRRRWRGPLLIGAAWQCQQQANIASADWDIALDRLVNERQTLRF